MIDEFIAEVCGILKISAPAVRYSGKLSGTMLAALSSDASELLLKKDLKPDIDSLFAVAHELRHAWQIVRDRDFYLSDYKTRDRCADIGEYNLQPAEIDANAFASVVISAYFPVRITFEKLPENVVKRIREREKDISAGIFLQP